MRLDDAAPTDGPLLIIGLLLALPTLAAIAWIFREVTGQRDSPSAPATLARALRASWRGAAACWRWSLSLSVAFWLAVAATFSASVASPARRRPPS